MTDEAEDQDEFDWSRFGLRVDGATISDAGMYTCTTCNHTLEARYASDLGKPSWVCNECGATFTDLEKKIIPKPAHEDHNRG